MQCPRCLRNHTGLCGIPGGVTKAFGARVTARSTAIKDQKRGLGAATKDTGVLEKFLALVEQEYRQVLDLLKTVPPELPEYAELLIREEKLAERIKQVKDQIAVKK